jgi:hypothetical protein
MKRVQQRHGIQAAGYANQNQPVAFDQPVVSDVLFDALEQIGHVLMLFHRRGEARIAIHGGNCRSPTFRPKKIAGFRVRR